MRVLFNTYNPANLTHGGTQIQIERTMQALSQVGVHAESFRWWDAQEADIFHHVGFLPLPVLRAVRRRGWKVVITLLLTETCNRPRQELLLRKLCVRPAMALPLPRRLKEALPWQAFHESDLMIVGLEVERNILEGMYGIPRERTAVVPLGLTETFLEAGPPSRAESHLICTGTIAPLKNSVELARLAKAAEVPILFVGKPHDVAGDYWKQFQQLTDDRFVKHQPHVGNEGLVDWLGRARGYVLMSRNENWSLAAHEAAACGLPLLVPDLPWSRERFGNEATYFPKKLSDASVVTLRRFYDQCPSLSSPKIRLASWREVAEQLREHYDRLLRASTQS